MIEASPTYHCGYTHTHTHTTVLLLFWYMSRTTRVSRYQTGNTRKVKTNLDLLEQEIVSGSGICWVICNAYSLRPHARSPPAGDTWVHFIPIVHTCRVPPCMVQSRLGAIPRQKRELYLLLVSELQFSIHSITGSYARTAATSAYVGLTVHLARSDAYHSNLTGR